MQTIQFILALAIGWFLVDHDQPWLWIGLWAVAASAALTLFTLVVQHVRLPPASRSRRGLTVFHGQFRRLFFGTIITILVAAVVVLFIRQRPG